MIADLEVPAFYEAMQPFATHKVTMACKGNGGRLCALRT